MSYNARKFNDTVPHAFSNVVNCKPKKDVTGVLQGGYEVLKGLWEQNIIKDSEQTRYDLNGKIFDKLTAIEKIQEKSNLLTYFKQRQVEYQNLLNERKNTFNKLTKEFDSNCCVFNRLNTDRIFNSESKDRPGYKNSWLRFNRSYKCKKSYG